MFEKKSGTEKRARREKFGSQPRFAPAESNRPRPDERQVHQQLAIEGEIFSRAPGLEDAVEKRGDQTRLAIEQSPANDVETSHCPERPKKRDRVQRHPVVFSSDLEDRGVSPEQQRRLALDRVDVWPAAIDNLVRHHGINRFIIDGLRMNERWQPRRDREQHDRRDGELELSDAPD